MTTILFISAALSLALLLFLGLNKKKSAKVLARDERRRNPKHR